MSQQLPDPLFTLGAKVRYRPYHTPVEWPESWHPQPWKIIGRTISQFVAGGDTIQYTIQPWELTGTWMVDRPVVVFETYLEAWPDTADLPAITAEAERRQRLGLETEEGRHG